MLKMGLNNIDEIYIYDLNQENRKVRTLKFFKNKHGNPAIGLDFDENFIIERSNAKVKSKDL